MLNLSTHSTVSTHPEKIVAFFIGGAGDKAPLFNWGPTNIMLQVKTLFRQRIESLAESSQYQDHYLSFDEIYEDNNIEKNVIHVIPNTQTPIYIIGMSFGALNGAHLAQYLLQRHYSVEMLVTLDPACHGLLSRLAISKLHEPITKTDVKTWINIYAQPVNLNASDLLLTGQLAAKWRMQTGPTVDQSANLNHDQAQAMFVLPLENGYSAADLIYQSVKEKLYIA